MSETDRENLIGKKVKVYRNLHKGMWSVVDASTGRVAFHAATLSVSNAEFRVSLKVRERVVMRGRKEVHAKVVGTLDSVGVDLKKVPRSLKKASYNPYKAPFFFLMEDMARVDESPLVVFDEDGHLRVIYPAIND
jgi:hypothetical protein